mmetsp:Transcript_29566/g.44797  ORF Transcript_29566/g.44797 Transcript_29566/m.44797 type:complete len:94 (+) Transcript_29566:57-338(+)|eukprot:CAMPEP_0178920056 /NCGR_PEP_ID=MMETSP0786-20121207/14789_1 /TAXON_ID=186022 /ORGANISM="Thalassionema frauenfeldii, Strain CCMP 1798" /LENGTH=93 /DNA_ID=CAMNT_0020594073 /DNA_START=33 /DNA_END=314 /DNA_ORIENTATION=+
MMHLSYEQQKNYVKEVLRSFHARDQMLKAIYEKELADSSPRRKRFGSEGEEQPKPKKQKTTLDPALDEIADEVGTVFGWEQLLNSWDTAKEEI